MTGLAPGKNGLLSRLCPVCGKEVRELYNGVCEECFRARWSSVEVPRAIEVTVCKVCGAYKLGGRWRKAAGGDPIVEAVKAEVKRRGKPGARIRSLDVSLVEGDRVTIRVVSTPEGGVAPQEELHEAALHVQWALCSDCIMAKSRREAARIQVRARGRPLTASEVEEVKRIVERGLSARWRGSLDLFEVEEREGGVDFVFSSQPSARLAVSALKRELFASILETRKSAGSVSGKPVARITLRVLLPGFRPGDVIEFGQRVYYVLEVARQGVRVLCLQTYDERTLSNARQLIERTRVVLRREELESAVVASVTGENIDVVLTRSQSAISFALAKKPGWLIEGRQVMLAFINGQAYPVPLVRSTK